MDVAVVGAGPAGAATALLLARAGFEVALIDRWRERPLRVGETVPGTIALPLETLGLRERFLADGHLPSTGVRAAWGGEVSSVPATMLQPYGAGWHLDRARFERRLVAEAARHGARLELGTPLRAVRREGEGFGLDLGDGPRLGARFVVDASGRHRVVARQLGARVRRADRLVAAVGWQPPGPAKGPPRLELAACPEGWCYTAPLPDGGRVVVALGDPGRLPPNPAALFDLDPPPGPPRLVAADSSALEPVAGPGWAAVGDAAAAHDPLAGHGILRALQSACRLAEAVAARFHGSPAALRHYQEMQRQSFEAFLVTRAQRYAEEQRWPEAPFWRIRMPDSVTAAG